ncbi:MAG: RtcB family protein [Oscillospiraceae bacterium]
MLTLNGKYNSANVYTDIIDNDSIRQIIELCNQEFTKGETIRMMPDVHAGAGCTIGTTMTISNNMIVPNLVGVDIGCGMETVILKEKHIEPMKLDKVIRDKIPMGFNIRDKAHKFFEKTHIELLYCYDYINPIKAERSIGTLGGGNHFIEVDKGSNGKIYLVVHSGSRHLGLQVAKYYQEEAYKQLNHCSDVDIKNVIDSLKSQGRQKEIEKTIKSIKNTKTTSVPKHLAYVRGELFNRYIHDMKIIQEFALINRQAMIYEIVKGMNFHIVEQFSTIHNYIDTENMILRKGAVSSQLGEKLIIPINMRDGSLICTGKGNPDWNYSAPHGAGRLMSRSQAKNSFTVSEFKKQMKGIYSTSIGSSTLDECPMAYKSIDDILGNIEPTVEVNDIIKPIYNIKAGEEEE